MALNRCDNGHYFDPAKYAGCPSCAGVVPAPAVAVPAAAFDGYDDGHTRRRDGSPADTGRTIATATAPLPPPAPAADSGRTERLVRKQIGIDPVVGWLVGVAGPERGADHRLHSERNFIGRGDTMDVRLASDKTISRENHASISFDPKKDSFRLLPGEARGLVYLNGDELVSPTLLKAGDRIELGETTLLFVPLCGNGFRWEASPRGDAAD